MPSINDITQDLGIGDLDNDGDLDISITDITATSIGDIKATAVDAEIADFNGDGKPDLYFSKFGGSDVLLFHD